MNEKRVEITITSIMVLFILSFMLAFLVSFIYQNYQGLKQVDEIRNSVLSFEKSYVNSVGHDNIVIISNNFAVYYDHNIHTIYTIYIDPSHSCIDCVMTGELAYSFYTYSDYPQFMIDVKIYTIPKTIFTEIIPSELRGHGIIETVLVFHTIENDWSSYGVCYSTYTLTLFTTTIAQPHGTLITQIVTDFYSYGNHFHVTINVYE